MSLTDRWRIIAMQLWDTDAIDLVGPGFIEFNSDQTGQFGFIAVQGWMDCRDAIRDGRAGSSRGTLFAPRSGDEAR